MKSVLFVLAALGVFFSMGPTLSAEQPPAKPDVKVDGWDVTVDGQTFAIDPPTVKDGTFDTELKDGKPNWQGPIYLSGPAWVFDALRPESLVATLASDPKVVLKNGKDYAVDVGIGTVGGIPGSKAAAGTKVHFAYKYGMSRIDLIARTTAGKMVLVKGKEDRTEPHLPEVPTGDTAVASVYLANAGRPLTPADVNIIDPHYDGVPPVTRVEGIKGVKEKMAAGKPVTIVFFGDSITAQPRSNFRDEKGSFVDRFSTWLKAAYPGSSVWESDYHQPAPEPQAKQIRVIKAGVGGDDTARALKRIEKDVLAWKPDAVVVMLGVNDENRSATGNEVPLEKYKANLREIVDRITHNGGEVVLMTPSMKNLGWDGTTGKMADYAAAMRSVAAEKKICLIDQYAAWEQLPKRGYNYMVFLGNCLNHPIDLGHDLFFRGLKAAFEQPGH